VTLFSAADIIKHRLRRLNLGYQINRPRFKALNNSNRSPESWSWLPGS